MHALAYSKFKIKKEKDTILSMNFKKRHASSRKFAKSLTHGIKSKNDKYIYNFLHELEFLGFKDKIESSSSNQTKITKFLGLYRVRQKNLGPEIGPSYFTQFWGGH